MICRLLAVGRDILFLIRRPLAVGWTLQVPDLVSVVVLDNPKSVLVREWNVLQLVSVQDPYILPYAASCVRLLLAVALRLARSDWNLRGVSVSKALDGRSDTYAGTHQGYLLGKAR